MGTWFTFIGSSANGKTFSISLARKFIHHVWDESGITPTEDPWLEASGSVAGLLTAVNEHYVASRETTVCMLYSNEFSSIFKTREAIAEFLCSLADGQTIQRNLRELQKGPRQRAGRLDRVYSPTTSGLFATTEAAMQAVFTADMRDGGLFARTWWVKPEFDFTQERRGTRADECAEEFDAAVLSWMGWFAGLNLHEDKCIRFSEAGWAAYRAYCTSSPQPVDSDDELAQAVAIRGEGCVEVFSALYATVSGRTIIEPEDVARATQVVLLLRLHARKMAHLGLGDFMHKVERAQTLIAKAGEQGLSRRDIYRKLTTDKRTIDAVLDTLLDRGTIYEDRADAVHRYVDAGTARASEIREIRGLRDPENNVIDLSARRSQKHSPDEQ